MGLKAVFWSPDWNLKIIVYFSIHHLQLTCKLVFKKVNRSKSLVYFTAHYTQGTLSIELCEFYLSEQDQALFLNIKSLFSIYVFILLPGCLYTNFTLLWVPVQSLVAGYGNYIKREHFWNIFGAKLLSADQDIQTYLRELQDGSFSRSNEASKRVDYIKVGEMQ